jgi:predicted dehydrogenase
VALLRRAIERGRLGRLFVADAHVKWFREPAYYEAARWRGTRALDGGGALMNQAIHTVDLLQHLAGPVAAVTGYTARLRHPGIECEDTAVAALKFQNGALGLLQATTSVAPGFSRRVELSGERGTVILDGNDISVWKVEGTGEEEVELERLRTAARDASDGSSDPMRLDIAGHRTQLEDFVAAVAQGREPIVTGGEALKALGIVLAVYESAASGRPVAPRLQA